MVRVFLSGLRAGMKVILESLECLLNCRLVELVSLEFARVVSDWVEDAAQRFLLEEGNTDTHSIGINLELEMAGVL